LFKGVLPWYFAHVYIILYSVSYSFFIALLPIIQQLTVYFVKLSSYSDAVYFNIIHSLSLSFPLLPPCNLLRQTHYYNHVLCLSSIYVDI
jgi:hypothetical protein